MLRIRSVRRYGLTAAMGLALAAFFMPKATVPALAQAMAVPGEVSVNATGAATYSVPIAVPPGTAGMVPSLSLTYNSQAGNGVVGMGFTLEGLAAIGRCPQTVAQDGVHGAVNFDANDRFCLDGQRLMVISGTYGADGSEYRTEIESFAKVIAHGSAGSGPAWFEVRTKSGQVMEFGNSADSRVLALGKAEARTWSVNKVSDTKGNYYTVTYVNDTVNGQAYPSRIDYTGNAAASLAPYNSVRFVYDTARPDVTTAYHAGAMVKTTVRLTNVQTYAGDTLVSDYRLTYTQGTSTGRSQLTSLTICDGSGTCLPATSFAWQNGTTNYTVVNNVGGQDGQLVNYRPYVADFNGDGLPDVLWDSSDSKGDNASSGNHVLWSNSGGGNFQVILNWLGQDGSTVSDLSNDQCNGLGFRYRPMIADYNRDGHADIWWYRDTCGADTKTEARTSRTIEWFSNPSGGYTFQEGPAKANTHGTDSYSSFEPRLLDVNGDGRPDIAWFKDRISTQTIWQTQQNGTIVEGTLGLSTNGLDSAWPITTALGKAFSRASTIDFNADGFSDILRQASDSGGMNQLLLGNGDNSFRQVATADSSVSSYTPSYGDFNGDGQTDILWDQEDSYNRSKGNRILWFSKGDGTFVKITNAGGQDGTLASSQHRPYIADFNGDGLPDILWDAEDNDSIRSTGERVLWLNKGENQFTVIANFAGQNGALVDYAPSFGDFNGDGKTDILWDKQIEGDSRSQGQRVLWLSDGIVPDLMTGVTNGIGATASFTYKSLTDGSVYTKDSDAVDPIADLQGPIQVVARLDHSNGIGGQISTAYAYVGAKVHQDGRGFLGFRQEQVTDLQTGIMQTTTFRQDYPFIGLVAGETKVLSSLTLSSTTNSHDATNLGGTRRQVFLTQGIATGTDLSGAALPATTTTYQYDAFGNANQIAVSNSDGYSKTTTNTYSNDAGNWLLGRLLTATVTSQAPAVAAQIPAIPAPDTTPDAFHFTDIGDAQPNTVYEDSAVLVGFDRALTATVSGGGGAQIRKNGIGDWGTSVIVTPGDRMNVRMQASSAFSTTVTATVTIGGVSGIWNITTTAAPVPPSLSYIGTAENTVDIASGSPTTFSNQPIGNADSTRRVFAVVTWGSSASPVGFSSATIAGVPASVHVNLQNTGTTTIPNAGILILSALVPTGTTGNIVYTFTGGPILRSRVSVYSALSLSNNSPSDALTVDIQNQSNSVSGTIDIPDQGILLAALNRYYATSPVLTWTGATVDNNQNAGDAMERFSAAHATGLSAETGRTVKVSFSKTNIEGVFAALSWH